MSYQEKRKKYLRQQTLNIIFLCMPFIMVGVSVFCYFTTDSVVMLNVSFGTMTVLVYIGGIYVWLIIIGEVSGFVSLFRNTRKQYYMRENEFLDWFNIFMQNYRKEQLQTWEEELHAIQMGQ